MNEVTVTFNGTTEVFQQDDIISPKFDCDGCYSADQYVARIAEYGMRTVTNNGDGSFTYRQISPHCICSIEFVDTCDQP